MEAIKANASVPPGHCLDALENSRNLQFPHRVPFTKKKMPWCPFSFKNETYRPATTSEYSCENSVLKYWIPSTYIRHYIIYNHDP